MDKITILKQLDIMKQFAVNNNFPCKILIESDLYDLSDCPDYGSSSCNITMNLLEQCTMDTEELRKVIGYKWS